MATLFFEGFDKGVVFNELDPKHWSTQFKYFPKYAFGGYTPYVIEDNLSPTYLGSLDPQKLGFLYRYSTPTSINGLVPSGRYTDNRASFSNGYGSTYFSKNSYPGFGSPPGFLAFTNIELENSTSVEYPTYLQASGFPVSTGSISYLSMRCLGLESKHSDYSSYPYRHTLFSLNSGNFPTLTVNVVKISGDNLLPINGKKETLALEIQQNEQTLGYFDLNLSGTINRYQISSVFNSNNNKILTITDTNIGEGFSSMISRWCHLEFSVDKSTSPPLLYINAEDINLTVVNSDPTITKELWDISLPISGFNFNNLRFYNRTYSSAVMNGVTPSIEGEENWKDSWYYMRGRVWLLDDLALVDNTDPPPSYWLGSSAKVMSVYPGVSGSLIDNYGSPDGLLKWYKDPTVRSITTTANGGYTYSDHSSHRRAFLIPDADGNYIETVESGNIDAVKMSRPNYQLNIYSDAFDSASVWRGNFNDAIGGMKVYNSARKKYLDTKFINVLYSGQSDIYEPNISLLLHGDSTPIVDNSTNPNTLNIYGSTNSTASLSKIGSRSISFPNQSSYIYLNYPDLSTSPFTIESWVYFTNNTTSISLFDKVKLSAVDPVIPYDPDGIDSKYYSFTTNISGIQYISDYANHTSPYKIIRQLIFPSNASTGVWHHVAITRNSNSGIICFLNGQSGNAYKITNSGTTPFLGFPDTAGTFNTMYKIPDKAYSFSIDQADISSYFVSYYSVKPYLSIGKDGYIDEYRITSGINRYTSNFTPSTGPFKTKADDYIEIGPQHNVTKTSYKTYQYYVNQNPITQQNWTLPEVTGLIFGVKKL
jgi:hypothetical protein